MDKTMAGDASLEVPEKLGSFNLPESQGDSTGPQIRTSARVYKKMRLDASLSSERKDSESGVEPDSSEGKPSESKSSGKASDSKTNAKSDQVTSSTSSKGKLAPPAWSAEAKDTFFEALNEHGKDFESIHNVFTAKARERDAPENFMKNKDQIRVFYFRTFYKLSNYLTFSDDVKRETQELYALINYGEFRKHVKSLSEKIRGKLNQLVHRGHTHFRFRDKFIRVKTPQCPALQRLNRMDDWKMELQLPPTVTVELRPRTMRDWCQVQSVAQNPRVRTVLPLEQRLSSLLAFLEQRWRPSLLQHRDKLLSSVLLAKLHLEVRAGHAREPPPVLHVAPAPGVRIALPTFYCSDYLTSSSLSLAAYRERQAKREANLTNPLHIPSVTSRPRRRSYFEHAKVVPSVPETENGKKASVLGKDVETIVAAAAAAAAAQVAKAKAAAGTDGLGTTAPPSAEPSTAAAATTTATSLSIDSCLTTAAVSSSAMAPAVSASAVTDASVGIITKPAASTASLSVSATGTCPSSGTDTKPAADGSSESKPSGSEAAAGSSAESEVKAGAKPEVKTDSKAKARAAQLRKERAAQIEAIRNGWCLETAQAITVGELYLMFGRDGKLQLEYWLEEKAPSDQTTLVTENAEISPMSKMLQKLVSIAKLNYQKSKLLCPCGHVCGVSVAPMKAKKAKKNPKEPQERQIGGAGPRPPTHRLIPQRMLLPTVQDGVFRRPVFPSLPNTPSSATEILKTEMEKFRPRYCNRRGRSVRQKGVVVQRMLPLLPKVPNGQAMVALVAPQTSSSRGGKFVPIGPQRIGGYPLGYPPRLPPPRIRPRLPQVPKFTSPYTQSPFVTPMSVPGPPEPPDIPGEPTAGPSTFEAITCVQSSSVVDMSEDDPPVPSSPAPSITNLLELELSGGDDISLGGVSAVSSGILDAALAATEAASSTQSFSGLLQPPDSTEQHPPSPPLIDEKPPDQHWLNCEVGDFSLSSLLGTLESPVKHTISSAASLSISVGGEETRLSEVETQMQCLMSENSVDYTAKFADLAARIASEEKK